MPKISADYHEGLIEALKDPVEAAEYINAALDEGSKEMLLLAIQDVANAMLINELKIQSASDKEKLCEFFSDEGSFQLLRLSNILKRIGLRLAVEAQTPVAA